MASREQATTTSTSKKAQVAKGSKNSAWPLRLGIIATVAATAIVGNLVVSASSVRPVGSETSENRIAHEVTALLSGIPQHGNTLGSPLAPVTITLFADLECLTVKNWVVFLLPAIIEALVRTNDVKIEYRALKTDTHNRARFLAQQAAALAAGAQGMMWNFIETFYHEQGKEYSGYVTESYLEGIASQVPGLDLSQWDSDRRTIQLARRVAADNETAHALGFIATPSFLIGRTGGKLVKLIGHYVTIDFRKSKAYLIEPADIEEAIENLP